MPLRDHFRSPLIDVTSWDGLHGAWPTLIVIDLNKRLPPQYVASPRIHLGASFEINPEQDEYEVRIFESETRRLVAAVEIVSPANKDRPEHRRAFAAKCAALLQQGVSVSIVDLVTTRRSNLYGELLDLLGQADPSLAPAPPPLYAVACRWRQAGRSWHLETWLHALAVGQAPPTLPLWLAADLAVPLDLEPSYEETCRILRIV